MTLPLALLQLVNRTGLPIVVGQKWTASSVTLIGGQQPTSGSASWTDTDALLREAVVAVVGGPSCGGGPGADQDLLGVLTGNSPDAAPRIFSLGPKARTCTLICKL